MLVHVVATFFNSSVFELDTTCFGIRIFSCFIMGLFQSWSKLKTSLYRHSEVVSRNLPPPPSPNEDETGQQLEHHVILFTQDLTIKKGMNRGDNFLLPNSYNHTVIFVLISTIFSQPDYCKYINLVSSYLIIPSQNHYI